MLAGILHTKHVFLLAPDEVLWINLVRITVFQTDSIAPRARNSRRECYPNTRYLNPIVIRTDAAQMRGG